MAVPGEGTQEGEWAWAWASERPGRAGSWGEAEGCSVWRAGRRQRHSIAGQMTYLKMLGVTMRDKEAGAAGLFSTAVISGSSSAPNLRVMIPTAAAAANCK